MVNIHGKRASRNKEIWRQINANGKGWQIKNRKTLKAKETGLKMYSGLWLGFRRFATALGAFLIAFVCASILAPVKVSDAQDFTVNNSRVEYYVDVSSSHSAEDPIAIEVLPTGGSDGYATTTDVVTTKTNAPGGYKLYLSMNNDDENGNSLFLGGTNSDDYTAITAVDATFATPAALTTNTWGYTTTAANVESKVFSGVNLKADAEQIASYDQATSSAGDARNVYFAVSAGTGLVSGEYSNTILYTAIAEAPEPAPTMQDFTTAECAALETDRAIALSDSRDGKIYNILKARDGNCWMVDNLAIDNITITPEDSNIYSDAFTIPESSNWGSTASVTDAFVHVATKEGYEGEHYYTWAAATAGATPATDTSSVTTSICPKGWRLPINGDDSTDKSYAKLMDSYNVSTGADLLNEAHDSYVLGFHKYYGGWHYYNGAEGWQGAEGNFWSSSSASASNAYQLNYRSSGSASLYPQYSYNKPWGFSVRCVFGDSRTMADITYMQDINTDICKNTAEGYSKTLLDKRGNYSGGSQNSGYGVIKAKDGNCWMRENFNLYNKTITAELSDFTSGSYALPTSENFISVDDAPKIHKATASEYADVIYYNYCAISATTTDCLLNEATTQSICPRGWKLPEYSQFIDLYKKYDINTGAELVPQSDLGFTKYYGYYDRVATNEQRQGTFTHMWTATAGGAGRSQIMLSYVPNTSIYSANYDKRDGYPFRCVAR